MPVPTNMVGDTVGPIVHEVDARWTMAYSAALGDTHPCYLDTRRSGGVVAHPLFAVCAEWPVIVAGRDGASRWGITPAETQRSIHATHDLHVHRLVRPGDTLTTSLTYTGVEQRHPGAYSTMRLDTVDGTGKPVSTTYQGGFHLGVETTGDDRPDDDAPELPTRPDLGAVPGKPLGAVSEKPLDSVPGKPLSAAPRKPLSAMPREPLAEITVPVAGGMAHTYTESARIWNPIHTDAAVAEQAGLPATILHGTATLALGVSAVVRELANGRPELVRRICCRFAAMVLMPSTLTVRIHDVVELPAVRGGTAGSEAANDGVASSDESLRAVRFQVLTQDSGPAVDQGVVVLGAS